MKKRLFLAIILLSLSFCLVSGVVYGEVKGWLREARVTYIGFALLEARVDYMATNPASFLDVSFHYDSTGTEYSGVFPRLIDTKAKIIVLIFDNRNRFSSKSGISLLNSFKKNLETVYSFIPHIATDMDTDIIAVLYTGEEIPLAYFYQGEYHLWEE